MYTRGPDTSFKAIATLIVTVVVRQIRLEIKGLERPHRRCLVSRQQSMKICVIVTTTHMLFPSWSAAHSPTLG